MNYEVKTGAESIWLSVQLAIATAVGWALLAFAGMDAMVVVPIASAVGSVSRPVLGYVLSWLPKRGEG